MMTLPLLARPAWLAAVLAAIFFAAGLILAWLTLPGWQPAQHPLALLPRLPGWQGLLLAGLLFVAPGGLLALSAWLRGRQASRLAGVSGQLLLLSGIGFLLMGVLPLPMGEGDGSGRVHALAWMLWLAASAAAMVLDAVARMAAGHWRSGLAVLLAAGVLLVLCMTAWLPLAGPLAQLGGWAIWLGWAQVVARQLR